jgi:hypothetical protein
MLADRARCEVRIDVVGVAVEQCIDIVSRRVHVHVDSCTPDGRCSGAPADGRGERLAEGQGPRYVEDHVA